MRLWRDWLPDIVSDEAASEEPQRFCLIVSGLCDEWARDADPAATLKWVSLINSYVHAKGEYRSEDLNRAANTILDILLASQHHAAAQARWASSLTRILRTWRHELSISIQWRPVYDLLQSSVRSVLTSYEGYSIMETKRSALFNLVHRCRRFFPPGSADQIWDELKGSLQNLHTPAAQQTMGWLALFLPTHGLLRGEGGWNDRVGEWMTLWESDAHNNFWRGHWMLLFGQVAKHDIHGTIDWAPYLPRLFNQLQWAFSVPVGTASATPPFGSAKSPVAATLFHNEVHTLATTAGKIIVYTLATTSNTARSSGSQAGALTGNGKAPVLHEGEDSVDDPVLSQLEQLVDLLEQYFHPSNFGRWNKYLGKFVTSLCKHLNKRLAMEANAGSPDSASQSHDAQGMTNGAAQHGRAQLSTAMQRQLAQVILRMADKAQYSKDNSLAVAACSAMSQMAYIAPDLVLPLVQSRFQVALENVQSNHQLVSAIHTLALCVRPLLLAGFAAQPETADSGPVDAGEHKAAGGEAVAAALMATLPGIDANDPSKTLACFRLYCMVLSSIGMLQGGPDGLPLYAEEWVEELLSRVFDILTNPEAPETRSDHSAVQGNSTAAASDQASFLIEGSSMFRPMMEVLFARLPEDLQLRAIKQTARFVTTSTLASVTNEASLICNAAAWAAPQASTELLLKPLLHRIEEEVWHDGTSGASRMSKVQEATLDWLVGVTAATALHLGPALLPYKAQIKRVLAALFAAPSQAVQSAASKLLAPLLGSLTSYYPLDQFAPLPAHNSPIGAGAAAPQGVGIEPWLSSKPPGSQVRQHKPTWHQPTAHEIEFAEELVSTFLTEAAEQLLGLSQGQGSGQDAEGKYPKEKLQGLLLRMEGSFMGLQSMLPDFPSPAQSHGAKLALIGVGGRSVATPQTRELAAKALVAAAGFVGPNDSATLKLLLRAMGAVVSRGAQEYRDAQNSFSAWRTDQDIAHDPAVSALLFTQYGEGGGKWGRRRPRWLMVERTYLHGLWRASQAANKAWATTESPSMALEQIPVMHKAVFQQLVHFSMHSYKGVRDLAVLTLEGCMKQYPAYAMQLLPLPLSALAKVPIPQLDLEHPGTELSPEVMKQLRGAMREAAGKGSAPAADPKSDGALSTADAAKEEGIVQGAAALLRGQSLFRAVSRQPSALAGLVTGLMAGSQHSSPQAQQAIMECFVLFVVRFIRPPQLAIAQASEGQYPNAVADMMTDLLFLASPNQAHWRYSQRAGLLLLFMLPTPNADSARKLTQHFLSLVLSQLPSQRSLGLTGLLVLLRGGQRHQPAVRTEVQQALQGQAQFGPALLEQMSHAHPSGGQDGPAESHFKKMMGMSKDDAMITTLATGFDGFSEWPYGVGSPEGIEDQSFMPRHARLILALTDAAPGATLEALQGPLQDALQQAQHEDRPQTFAAAEMLCGLIASSSSFQALAGGTSAWEGWLKGMLQTGLAGAPLDMAEAWAAAVRFVVHSLARTYPAGLNLVLDVIMQAPPQGDVVCRRNAESPSSATVKRLKYIGECLQELSTLGVIGTDDTNPLSHFNDTASISNGDNSNVANIGGLSAQEFCVSAEAARAGRKFQQQFLRELLSLMVLPGESLRHHVSWCASILFDSLMWQAPCESHVSQRQPAATGMDVDRSGPNGTGPNGVGLLLADVEEYSQKIVQGMEAGAAAVSAGGTSTTKSSSSSQHPTGPTPMDSDHTILSSALGTSASAPADSDSRGAASQYASTAVDQTRRRPVAASQGASDGDTVMQDVQESLQAQSDGQASDIHTDNPALSVPSGASAPQLDGDSAQSDKDVAQLGFAVQFVVQGLRNGAGPTLMPLLVQLLPYLLKTQELQTPELQPLSMESKAALALLKYLPLNTPALSQVIQTLKTCAQGEPWASRAACLVFTQYFWFRHCFLLMPEQSLAVQQLVVDMLADNKLEVQELAAKTLSGLLKGSTPAQFDQLRQHFLDQVATLFPVKKRAKKPALPSRGSTSEKHAAVLGLKAFVLTSPYDVPSWLPEVLMALVKAAGEPAPIKSTVRHALGEFRRTHEEAGLADAKRLLTAEQWDAIQDVSSPASYFV